MYQENTFPFKLKSKITLCNAQCFYKLELNFKVVYQS